MSRVVAIINEHMRGNKKDLAKLPVGPLKKGQDEKMLQNLGETVKRLRKCAHISQEQIAETLSLHQTAVCRVELGLQSLQPWHLQKLAELYDIRVTSLLSGQINYWQVAQRFNQPPPFPPRYLELAFSKVRELLPLLQFMAAQKGQAYTRRLLEELSLDLVYLRGPDQPMGVNCTLDLLRRSVKTGTLTDRTLKNLVDETRSESVQGFLHSLYQTQSSAMSLVKSLILNAHHYESNFVYTMDDDKGQDGIVLTVKPAEHMKFLPYKDETLGDILCRYKREYLTQFPLYIGAKPMRLEETECHFHGAAQCVYKIRAA